MLLSALGLDGHEVDGDFRLHVQMSVLAAYTHDRSVARLLVAFSSMS